MSASGKVSDLLADAKAQLTRFSRANPALETLPDWVGSFRSWQRDAVDDITNHFNNVDLVILDGPPGTGKTLVAEACRRFMAVGSCLYICNSKSLQAQFVRNFDYASLLQGRANYATEKYPRRFNDPSPFRQLSCADCNKASEAGCSWCASVNVCPYERAKSEGLRNSLTILNTAYFLTEVNGPGRFKGRGLVVVDECDTLERELMGYVSIELSPQRAKRIGIGPPSKVTVPAEWITWLDISLPKIEAYRDSIPTHNPSVRDIRESKGTDSLLSSLRRIQRDLLNEANGWVYNGRGESISFKPTKVNELARQVLWPHGKQWLLMSGSVVSADEIIDSLGWEANYEVVSVPSPYSPKNRPVYVRPVANMARSADGKLNREQLVKSIRGIIARTDPYERVLLHTVSYNLTESLQEGLREYDRPVGYYLKARDREHALAEYVKTEGAILLAPSFDRGIDLPDDYCRTQIICKVPFPNLGDRQISARLHSEGGQLWYSVQTARTLIQMTGRAVRHKDDWANTYILDEQFLGFFKKNKWLFPQWWTDALVWRY